MENNMNNSQFSGRTCGSGELTFCRKNIAETISGIIGNSEMCTGGDVELMKLPVGYVHWIVSCINITVSI